MKSNDVTDEFLRLSAIKLSSDEHENIWDNIERDLESDPDNEPGNKSFRSPKTWGRNIAAIAAIAVVAGGITVYRHHASFSVSSGTRKESSSSRSNIPALGPVHYSSTQLSQIKTLGERVKVDAVWLLTKYVQNQLSSAAVYSNTVRLNYEGLTVYEGSSMSKLKNALTASNHGTLIPGKNVTLSSGMPGHWSTLKSAARRTDVLTVHISRTYVALMLAPHSVINKETLLSAASSWTIVPSVIKKKPSPIHPPAQDAAYTQVGKLRLGQTFTQVQKIYGNPTEKTTVHGEGGPEWIYKTQGMTLPGNPLWDIYVTSPFRGSLPSGIHIGSSKKAVQQAYPHAIIRHASKKETSFIEESPDKKYQMMIEVENGKVFVIDLTAATPSPPHN